MNEREEEIFAQPPAEALETRFDQYLALERLQASFEEAAHGMSTSLFQSELLSITEVKNVKAISEESQELIASIICEIFEEDIDAETKLLLSHDLLYQNNLKRWTVYAEILGEPLDGEDDTDEEDSILRQESYSYFKGFHSGEIDELELDDADVASSIIDEHIRETQIDLNIFLGKLMFPDNLHDREDWASE